MLWIRGKNQYSKILLGGGLIVGVWCSFSAFVWAKTEAISSQAVVETYAQIVLASYEDSLSSAQKLQSVIQEFLAAPTPEGLEAAKQAWLAAREPYGQTEAYRFYGGPIDDEQGPEGRLNAWPLDEAYLDAIQDKPEAGLINNPSLPLEKATLIGLNEKGSEENISTGYHAIEFLLWGQDFYAESAGHRFYTDFVEGQAPHAERRRLYLQLVTEVLVEDLQSLVTAWQPNAENFRRRFVKEKGSLRKIMVGIGVLSRAELAGERMEVALDSKSQEDEHSCFSDNTHRDIVNNAQGIANVWNGTYQRLDGSSVSGASLKELVAAKNPKVAENISAQLQQTLKAAQAIQAPFDQEIVKPEGRQRVQATIAALKKQANGFVEAAKVLGIKKLNVKG